MSGFSVDTSELGVLAADIGRVGVDAARNVHKALEVTARHVKDDARESVESGSSSWRGLPPAIDYELRDDPDAVVAEVGYNKGKAAGRLGNIREYGAPGAHRTVVGSVGGEAAIVPTKGRLARPPHSDLKNALRKNEADFEHGISVAVDDLLKDHGL